MVQQSNAAAAVEEKRVRSRFGNNKRPGAGPSQSAAGGKPAGDDQAKKARARSLGNVAVEITEVLTAKNSQGEQVPSAVRGTDVRTGAARVITLMTPQKAAELIGANPGDGSGLSFEDRQAKFQQSFANRKGVGDFKPGDTVLFQRVFEVEGQRTLQARWPQKLRSANAEHELGHAGLINVRGVGDEQSRIFFVSAYDDRKVVPLTRDPTMTDRSAIAMFGALEADGTIADRRLLVAVERAGEEPTVFTLGYVAHKNAEGKYEVPARDMAAQLYRISPDTNRSATGETPELSQKMMAVMVFEQHHDRHSGMAAAAIVGAMSGKSLDDAWAALKFQEGVKAEDKDRARDLLTDIREGKARVSMMPGAQYSVWPSVKERLAGNDKLLVGSGWYPGFVAAATGYNGKTQEKAIASFIAAEAGRPEWMAAKDVAKSMMDQLDAKMPAFAALKPSHEEESMSMASDPSPF